MASEFSWTCPQCGRIVPKRVGACRCGCTRETAGVANAPEVSHAGPVPAAAPTGPPAAHGNVVVIAASLVGVAVIAAAVILALSWRRPSPPVAQAQAVPAPAPVATPPPPSEPPDPDIAVPTLADLRAAPAADGPAPLGFEELVAQTLPAVVKVETRDGSGSAFFVSADTLLTNTHVVGASTAVNLRFAGGQQRSATVEKMWREVDLAVLKIDVVDPYQVFLAIARPADVKVGAEVIAIGSPLGFQNTVTRGIISGTRDFVYDQIGGGHVRVVQTDAAINPGNSGGPLIDRYGRVVGVNTFKIAGLATGLGFAVEMAYARRMLGPEFALKSDADQRREDALRKYDSYVRSLAQRADEREEQWKKLRPMCFDGPSDPPPPAREWFVMWDGPHGWRTTPACDGWRPVFLQWSKLIHDALAEYEAGAVEAGVAPEKLRQIRRRYTMSWPAWER